MSQQATFRVIEACLNFRRSDRNITEIPSIDLGRTLPGVLDFLDQNVILEVSPIDWSKSGTGPGNVSADGSLGIGHYYAQRDDMTITYRAASTGAFIRSDTFTDGFVFTDRFTNEVGKRQVFFRSRLTSSIIGDPDPSLWAGTILGLFSLNAYITVDLVTTPNLHTFINDHSSLGGVTGDIEVSYLSGPPPVPDPLITFPLP